MLTANSKEEKLRLQRLMEYGRNIPISETTVPKRKRGDTDHEITKDEIFNNLVEEIEERAQFLDDMEKLGEGKKYKVVIENEIVQKLNQMEMVDSGRLRQLTRGPVHEYYNKFLNVRQPKSLPLTALQFPYQ